MDKRIPVFFALFMLFFSGACAYRISKVLIQIDVKDGGTAKVVETYTVDFRNAADLANFRNAVQKNGSSLETWRVYDSNITTHIDSVKGGTGRVIFEEKEAEKLVSLEYETLDAFMLKKSETSRKIEWGINSAVFGSFEAGSVYAIPNNTDISIVLPKKAVLEIESMIPNADIIGNSINWRGPINVSGKLVLNYSTEKQIGPTIGISSAMQDFVSSDAAPTVAAAIVAVCALAYWKRKAISKKIENYVVDHSKIEAKQGIEEEELE